VFTGARHFRHWPLKRQGAHPL